MKSGRRTRRNTDAEIQIGTCRRTFQPQRTSRRTGAVGSRFVEDRSSAPRTIEARALSVRSALSVRPTAYLDASPLSTPARAPRRSEPDVDTRSTSTKVLRQYPIFGAGDAARVTGLGDDRCVVGYATDAVRPSHARAVRPACRIRRWRGLRSGQPRRGAPARSAVGCRSLFEGAPWSRPSTPRGEGRARARRRRRGRGATTGAR